MLALSTNQSINPFFDLRLLITHMVSSNFPYNSINEGVFAFSLSLSCFHFMKRYKDEMAVRAFHSIAYSLMKCI